MKFEVYTDPGHGWAKVKISLLEKLGIAKEITSYSYMRGQYAYLEEDQDASTFMQAMKKAGIPVEFKTYTCANRMSRIRNYASYTYS
jgi:ABC-type transport system substrate-binding protein